MPSINRIVGASVLATLALTPTAYADRAGTGAVRNPRVVQTHHITFTLPGDSWSQVRGVLGGGPSLGQYVFAPGPTPPISPDGVLRVSASAVVVMHTPTAGAKNTLILPGSKHTIVRIAHHGTNGPVRWWSGTVQQPDQSSVVVAYQRAPRSLDPTGKRWLSFRASDGLTDTRLLAAPEIRRQSAQAMWGIARTFRLAPGPYTTSGPYAPAN
jgi:hypothetical protein